MKIKNAQSLPSIQRQLLNWDVIPPIWRHFRLAALSALLLATLLGELPAQCIPNTYEFAACGDQTITLNAPPCSVPGMCTYTWSGSPMNGNGQPTAVYYTGGWGPLLGALSFIQPTLNFTDNNLACSAQTSWLIYRTRKDANPSVTHVAPLWTGSLSTSHKYVHRRYNSSNYNETKAYTPIGGTLLSVNSSGLLVGMPGDYRWDTLTVRWDTPSNGKRIAVQTNITDNFNLMSIATGNCVAFDTLNVADVIPITGPSAVCTASAIQYSVPPIVGATYNWTTGTGTIQSGQGTNQVSVAWTTIPDNLIVTRTLGGAISCAYLPITNTSNYQSGLPASIGLCTDSVSTLSANSGAFHTYLWSTGASTSSIVVNSPGTYTVTVTTPGACTITGTTVVNGVAPIQVNLGADQFGCENSNLTLDAGPGYTNYLWNNNASTQTQVFNAPGTFLADVAVVDVNGCQSRDTALVTVFPNPTFSLGPDQVLCPGNAIGLPGPSGLFTYTWSNGSNAQNSLYNTPGVHSLTVTDMNGCYYMDSILLYTNMVPVNIGPDTLLCNLSNFTLDAGPGYLTYSWNIGATTQGVNLNTSGQYSVTVMDVDGCTSADTALLNFQPHTPVNLGPDQSACPNTSVLLDAGPGHAAYSWSNGFSVQTTPVTIDGTYWVSVFDANGCNSTDTIDVSFLPNTGPYLGNDTLICTDGSVLLDAGPGFVQYIWSNAASTPSIVVNTPGTYDVTVLDAQGCTFSDTLTIGTIPDCVFPGDADYDGVADNNDVLALGVSFGATGSLRAGATTNWVGQPATDWVLSLPGGTNYKQSDCNGNGIVDANDTLAITLNYGATHSKMESTSGSPSLLAVEALFDSVQTGDTAIFRINLGTPSLPADSVYGVAFTVNYDTSVVDTQGILYSDFNFCWFAPPGNRLDFSYDLYPAPMADMAVVRTNGTDTLGQGEICRFGLVTIDNITGKRQQMTKPLKVWLSDIRLIDFSMKVHPSSATGDSIVVVDNTSSQSPGPGQLPVFSAYPNPTGQILNLRSPSLLGEIKLFDLQGKRLLSLRADNAKTATLDLGAYPNGVYILEVRNENGARQEKILIQR